MSANSSRRKVPMVFAVIVLITLSSGWIYLGGSPLIRVSFDISYTKAKNVYLGFEPPPFDVAILDEDRTLDVSIPSIGLSESPSDADYNQTLGIASRIYVIHLPHRIDRRENMDRLRMALNLKWTYVDAENSNSTVVHRIMDSVKRMRELQEDRLAESTSMNSVASGPEIQFVWPSELTNDTLLVSGEPLGLSGSDFWSLPEDFDDSSNDFSSLLYSLEEDAVLMDRDNDVMSENDAPLSDPNLLPLTCASGNSISGPPYNVSLPPYMIVTPAKVSCWHSHLNAIRYIAEGSQGGEVSPEGSSFSMISPGANVKTTRSTTDVGIILEDDIDMEQDIQARLQHVWSSLPNDWDIVFLGHCWSNESYHPPITPPSRGDDPESILGFPSLHPSFAPKCTHAYALSRRGARRLLLHLRHSPFAYSRALDQAFAWLVLSGRVKAFSVVPSVVVQGKMTGSDIDKGLEGYGSRWKESLIHGVLGTH